MSNTISFAVPVIIVTPCVVNACGETKKKCCKKFKEKGKSNCKRCPKR